MVKTFMLGIAAGALTLSAAAVQAQRKTDVQASNGIIHVIDSVILPDDSK